MKKNHRCSDCGQFLPENHAVEQAKDAPRPLDPEITAERDTKERASVEGFHRDHNPMGVGRKAPHRQY